jgi:hypothetical protein
VALIQNGIEQLLREFGRDFTGLTSLAIGADQLFAQCVLRLGGRLKVILPCAKYESTFVSAQALESFRSLLQKADEVETLRHARPSEDAFLDAGRRIAELSEVLLAVWDGLEKRGKGGTAEIVSLARKRGIDVLKIWPPGYAR